LVGNKKEGENGGEIDWRNLLPRGSRQKNPLPRKKPCTPVLKGKGGESRI